MIITDRVSFRGNTVINITVHVGHVCICLHNVISHVGVNSCIALAMQALSYDVHDLAGM